jgi:hypothetical protein
MSRAWALALFSASAALALPSLAAAELAQRGNLFVRFGGGITPRDLPRDSLAPIGVRIEGTIRTPASEDPPALREITVSLNRGGHLDPAGLPKCGRGKVAAADTSEALAACGPALIGSGGFSAQSSLPGQARALVRGEILLFNATAHGHPAIIGHLHQRSPAPITRVIVFSIKRSAGTYGTVISAQIPPATNRNGYLSSIYLQLQRNFTANGKDRAYLSASCAAPKGINIASFPFARAAMSFEDGRSLSSVLIRSCKVKS